MVRYDPISDVSDEPCSLSSVPIDGSGVSPGKDLLAAFAKKIGLPGATFDANNGLASFIIDDRYRVAFSEFGETLMIYCILGFYPAEPREFALELLTTNLHLVKARGASLCYEPLERGIILANCVIIKDTDATILEQELERIVALNENLTEAFAKRNIILKQDVPSDLSPVQPFIKRISSFRLNRCPYLRKTHLTVMMACLAICSILAAVSIYSPRVVKEMWTLVTIWLSCATFSIFSVTASIVMIQENQTPLINKKVALKILYISLALVTPLWFVYGIAVIVLTGKSLGESAGILFPTVAPFLASLIQLVSSDGADQHAIMQPLIIPENMDIENSDGRKILKYVVVKAVEEP